MSRKPITPEAPEVTVFSNDELWRGADALRRKVQPLASPGHLSDEPAPFFVYDDRSPERSTGDRARDFALLMGRLHDSMTTMEGGSSTEPFGPLGITADGVLIATDRRPSGQVNLRTQHVLGGEVHSDRLFVAPNPDNEPDRGLIVGTTGERLLVDARCLGLTTLTPLLASSDPSQYGLVFGVDISRRLDLSEEAYAAAHSAIDGAPTPIGSVRSLHPGGSAPQPVFPLAAFVDLSALHNRNV